MLPNIAPLPRQLEQIRLIDGLRASADLLRKHGAGNKNPVGESGLGELLVVWRLHGIAFGDIRGNQRDVGVRSLRVLAWPQREVSDDDDGDNYE